MKPSSLFAFAAAAGLASAQSISSDCSNALKGILASPDAACLNPSALLTIFVGSDQSVPDTINAWLTGLCSQGSCSNDVLAEVVNNVTSGCAGDFSGAANSITQMVQTAYPVVRNIMCLKDDNSNQLCVTETLNDVQNVVGQLTLSNFDISSLVEQVQNVVSNAANLACTNCVKAAVGLASQLTTQFPEIDQGLDAICGANFAEGSDASGVSQTALNGEFTAKKPNSALALSMNKLAGGFLLFVLSAFTLFA